MFTLNTTVPTPSVTVTAPNTQIVGQPLALTCNAVTVRGITSRVDIVWRRGDINLRRVENITSTSMSSTLVMYTDTYTISQLNTTDDGGVYECILEVNTSPMVSDSDTVTLNVSGEYCFVLYIHCELFDCALNGSSWLKLFESICLVIYC